MPRRVVLMVPHMNEGGLAIRNSAACHKLGFTQRPKPCPLQLRLCPGRWSYATAGCRWVGWSLRTQARNTKAAGMFRGPGPALLLWGARVFLPIKRQSMSGTLPISHVPLLHNTHGRARCKAFNIGRRSAHRTDTPPHQHLKRILPTLGHLGPPGLFACLFDGPSCAWMGLQINDKMPICPTSTCSLFVLALSVFLI